ncbi:MAG TPA: MFS transporter [Solirubrobacterales bacterium]|nr:MFS transporter [Solirubrobacterales bacterium]
MSSLSPTRRALLLLLAVAQLMVILDISAVNVALPDLSQDLRIAPGDLEWTITSYSLLFGSLLLLGGRAADLLGRRRTFITGLALFTGASLAAAVAPSAAALYAARTGQGIGAALLSPAALSIITTTFSGRERAIALGVWGGVGAAGGAVGVLLGGMLTEWIDWRAIFFINVPIGAALAAGVLRTVPADGKRPRWSGLDLRGALVATASLAALLYALSGADDAGWTSAKTLGLGGASMVGLAAFALLELRTALPLLRIRRLRDRAIGGGALLMLPASAILMGSVLLTSIYLQEVVGASPLETGIGFLPFAAAVGAGAHLGSHLARHVGVRIPMAIAFALAGAGMLLLSRVDGAGGYASDVLPGLVVAAVGLGVAIVSVALAVMTGAREDDAGMLSGVNSTGHEVGGSLGIAALTTIATGAIGSGGAAGSEALASGLGDAFLAAAGIAGAGMLLALLLLPAASRFLPRMREAPATVSIH